MSFPVDDFGMNIRAEVKAFNFGFSTAKNLASVIRANDKVTVVSFALPTHACFRPNGLGICPQNVTIIANSRYADQALELKQAYPDLRIFLDPRVHAKMTLASSGKVWLGSANMAMSNSLDSTIGIESPAVYSQALCRKPRPVEFARQGCAAGQAGAAARAPCARSAFRCHHHRPDL